eukprot:TRINITY_DN5316_c0_g1_i2.p1 TRINITY_DN5316_c0_g1~~TRINITY_DN5316_c0_g1_i2.p1  ORF type:complete len:146 (+),score=42.24 TRINITY_DN5316_c0_g1_i2:284-721(+)
MLSSSSIEVTESAQVALSSLIVMTGGKGVDSLINKFREEANIKIPRRSQLQTTEGRATIAKIHHGLLGLASVAKSQPYQVPSWLPEVLVDISHHLNSPRPLNKVAGEAIKEFWRTHQGEWVFLQHLFTREQTEAIKQSTSSSYFA